jgi:hypothetical protein
VSANEAELRRGRKGGRAAETPPRARRQDGGLHSPPQMEKRSSTKGCGAVVDLLLLVEDVFGNEEGGHGGWPAGVEGQVGHELDEFVLGYAVVQG